MAEQSAELSMSSSSDFTIAARSVQSLVVDKIRDAIVTGTFAPGQRVREAELCQRMGVSRTSVREALRSLEAERLITMIPNRGPVIAELTWNEAEQIYNVRALLEGEAAALAARGGKSDYTTRMREALIRFDASVSTGLLSDQVKATGDFYAAVLQACGNQIIAQIIEGLLARINLMRSKSMSVSGRSRYSAMEMWRILDAIENGDGEAARAAAIEHVNSAKDSAKSLLGKTSAVP